MLSFGTLFDKVSVSYLVSCVCYSAAVVQSKVAVTVAAFVGDADSRAEVSNTRKVIFLSFENKG